MFSKGRFPRGIGSKRWQHLQPEMFQGEGIELDLRIWRLSLFPLHTMPVTCSSLLQDFSFRSRDYRILMDATCKWLENKANSSYYHCSSYHYSSSVHPGQSGPLRKKQGKMERKSQLPLWLLRIGQSWGQVPGGIFLQAL